MWIPKQVAQYEAPVSSLNARTARRSFPSGRREPLPIPEGNLKTLREIVAIALETGYEKKKSNSFV